MKVLLTGGDGWPGRALARALADVAPVVAGGPDWDVTQDGAFLEKVRAIAPDVIVHCAALWGVAACEADRAGAFRRNEEGARNVALAAKVCGARLVSLSTGHVFSGEPPREPWAWGEMDVPRPQTVFGASMFAGEQMVQMLCPEAVILRTDGLYGAEPTAFVAEMLRRGAEEGAPIPVDDVRRGNPTPVRVVADALRLVLSRPDVSGIVHATCEDACTRCAFVQELFRLKGLRRGVVPSAGEGPVGVPKPRILALKKSVLNLLGYRTPNWKVALADFVREEFAK